VTCAAKPRGFTDTYDPWSDAIDNNPCGKKALLRQGPAIATTAEGCQGWWRLDESSGAVAYDALGANNANYVGSPILSPPGAQSGAPNGAVLLDGATQYIATAPTFPFCGDVFTLMVWARLSPSPPARQCALFSRNGAYLVRMNPSTPNFSLTIFSLGTVVTATGIAADTLWHHYTVAKNGATTTKLYVDGADVGGAVANQTCPNGSGSILIGASHNGGTGMEPFPGQLDEPMIFNTYLAPARIQEFAQGRDVSADSLCSFHYQQKYGQPLQQPIVVEP
jgi:hypothetical protein